MGVQIFLLILLVLASSSYLTFASDPSQLQDFCVAVRNPNVLVNGFICKNPREVNADDFFLSGLDEPGNTSNRVGSNVTAANVVQIPGLNTLGVSMARIDFAPYGLNPPHTHPRATEMLLVIEGTLYVGFVTSNTDNRLFTKTLRKGEIFVFPEGLIHFQLNVGRDDAVAVTAFGSQLAGTITIADAVFGSNPPISDDVLARGFQLDKNIVDDLQAKFAKN